MKVEDLKKQEQWWCQFTSSERPKQWELISAWKSLWGLGQKRCGGQGKHQVRCFRKSFLFVLYSTSSDYRQGWFKIHPWIPWHLSFKMELCFPFPLWVGWNVHSVLTSGTKQQWWGTALESKPPWLCLCSLSLRSFVLGKLATILGTTSLRKGACNEKLWLTASEELRHFWLRIMGCAIFAVGLPALPSQVLG